jgi:hypothetical protein
MIFYEPISPPRVNILCGKIQGDLSCCFRPSSASPTSLKFFNGIYKTFTICSRRNRRLIFAGDEKTNLKFAQANV